jgi:hypothetical protein
LKIIFRAQAAQLEQIDAALDQLLADYAECLRVIVP